MYLPDRWIYALTIKKLMGNNLAAKNIRIEIGTHLLMRRIPTKVVSLSLRASLPMMVKANKLVVRMNNRPLQSITITTPKSSCKIDTISHLTIMIPSTHERQLSVEMVGQVTSLKIRTKMNGRRVRFALRMSSHPRSSKTASLISMIEWPYFKIFRGTTIPPTKCTIMRLPMRHLGRLLTSSNFSIY